MGSGPRGAGRADRRPGGLIAGDPAGGAWGAEGGVGRGTAEEAVGEGWRFDPAVEKSGV